MFTVFPLSLVAVGVVLGLLACCMLRPSAHHALSHDPGPETHRAVSRPGLALGFVAVVMLLAAIILLARGVQASDPLAALDRAVSLALREHARPWITSVLRAATWLGSLVVVLPLTALGCALLVGRQRPLDAVLLATTTLGAVVLNAVAKLAVARPRPEFVLPLIARPETYSFPSGHAAAASAFYLLATLLATEGPGWTRGRRAMALAAALIVVGVVGLSRIYLGVHYLSDVAAGAALGTLWMVLCVVGMALWSARHGPAA